VNIDQTKPKRQKRTITLYLGNTLAEYEATYLTEIGLKALIRRVEIADSLDWGCLATGHEVGCPRQLHFTHHIHYPLQTVRRRCHRKVDDLTVYHRRQLPDGRDQSNPGFG
jgi:hypothetical protein